MITKKEEVRYHLEKALYLAKNGRPGPVWLDIPLDIQGALIDEDALAPFNVNELEPLFDKESVKEQILEVFSKLSHAKRPVIIIGNGVRLSGSIEKFTDLTKKLGVPVLTAISGVDLIAGDSEFFFGRPGIIGERSANFIMQNSDLLLILGTRMNLRVLGYAYDTFARDAFKIAVDIDALELSKPTLKLDLGIHSDVSYFISGLNDVVDQSNNKLQISDWLDYCNKCKRTFPVVVQEQRDVSKYVSSYVFAECLSQNLDDKAIIVTGNGTAYTSTFQAFQIKQGQRMFANVGSAAMGYDLPAAIGASIASSRGEVICVTGDGSIQMNIQELQTIVNYHLPIKIFVFNNDGYLSIKMMQKNFFNGNYVGSTPETGICLPNLEKISLAYQIPYFRINNHDELKLGILQSLTKKGPIICEVFTDPFETLYPKTSSVRLEDGRLISKPLEDLYPFLSREQFAEFMIVKQVEE
jgi:acetolactate synthase-1/2/3 large subunit